MVAQLFAGAFQRQSQHLAIHPPDDFLELIHVDQQKIFEDEHQMTDGLHQIGVVDLNDLENLLAGARIEPVEHLRHRADAAVGFAAVLTDGGQLLPDHGGDFVDDFR